MQYHGTLGGHTNRRIAVNHTKQGSAFLCCFIFLLLGLIPLSCNSKSEKVAIGREAPNFIYTDLNNEMRELKDFKGKVIFLRFWADWCPYCDVEMPIIDRVYNEIRDKGFVVLAVNVKQSAAAAKAYAKKFKLSYPIALDQKGEISKQYSVRGIPMNFLINREGVLKDLLVGDISDESMLKNFLKPYI
jgi:peroxiredoxin